MSNLSDLLERLIGGAAGLPGGGVALRGALVERLGQVTGLGTDGGDGHKDDLAVRLLGHHRPGLELPDLHGGRRAENIGCGTHELGGLDFGSGCDDLGLSESPLRRCASEKRLRLGIQKDILDQDRLARHAPRFGHFCDDLLDLGCDGLAVRNDGLQVAGTHHVAHRRLRTLDEGETDVGDEEGGAVWVLDGPTEHRLDLDLDIVAREDLLLGQRADLQLHVGDANALGAWIDPRETGVDGADGLCNEKKSATAF